MIFDIFHQALTMELCHKQGEWVTDEIDRGEQLKPGASTHVTKFKGRVHIHIGCHYIVAPPYQLTSSTPQTHQS